MDMIDKYAYRVMWSEEDEEHIGLCAELPSLSWLASTPGAALSGIRRAVKSVIADMRDTGENIPDPISARQFSGRFVVRVLPQTHRKLVLAATEAGVSLNRFVSDKLSSG